MSRYFNRDRSRSPIEAPIAVKGAKIDSITAPDLDNMSSVTSATGGSGGGSRSRAFHGGSDRLGTNSRVKLFVLNLPYEVDWRQMKEWVKDKTGEEAFCEIVLSADGKPSGFGLIEFRSRDVAEKVFDACNQTEIGPPGFARQVKLREMTERDFEKINNVRTGAGSGGGSGDHQHHGGSGGGGSQNNSSRSSSRRVQIIDHDQRIKSSESSSYLDQLISTSGGGGSINIPAIIKQLGIEPPLTKSVFIANCDYQLDEKKIKEVFGMAGNITALDLKRDVDGGFRGCFMVTYSTELEALQAVSMFNGAFIHERRITCRMDKYEQRDAVKNHQGLPVGVEKIGPGLAPDGSALKHIGIITELPLLMSLAGVSQQNNQPQLQQQQQPQPMVQQTPPPSIPSMGLSQSAQLTNLLSMLISGQPSTPAAAAATAALGLGGGNFGAIGSSVPVSNSSSMGQQGNGDIYGAPTPYDPSIQMPMMANNNDTGRASGRGSGQRGGVSDTVMVRNLPFNMTAITLRTRFGDVGEVKHCELLFDRQRKPLGTALITFYNPNDAPKATRLLDGARIEGRQIEVKVDDVY